MPCLPLIRHAATPSHAIRSAEFQLSLERDRIQARYALNGAIEALAIPARAIPARTDELWRSTCFELFLGRRGDAGYFELNFSASGQWAAYEFDDYRQGMRELDLPEVPSIDSARTPERFELTVRCTLPSALLQGIADLAASCVLELRDGSVSYWALAHAGPRPDFHARSSFTLDARRLHTAGSCA